MFELRPYQVKFIKDIRESFRAGHKRVCGVMPCGAGKTLATADMTKKAAARGNRTVFMVHRQELIEQTSRTFSAMGIEHGIIASSIKPNYELPVQIASVQTLVRRLDEVPPPKFMIVDECHHIEAATYKQIVEGWNCFLLGLTATPVRMGGKNLHDSFDELVVGPSVRELIEKKYLADFECLASQGIDYSEVKIKTDGDYTNDSMSRVMDRMEVLGNIVSDYCKNALNRKAICYCVNIEHSKHLAESFNNAGIRAAHLDGDTSTRERNDIIEQFRRDKISVLCNVNLFGEGFDVPNMDCVILARPTRSLTLFIQQSMRALRIDPSNPNKKALILDHVNDFERFGNITLDRGWSLEPNEEKNIDFDMNFPDSRDAERLKLADGEMIKIYDSTEGLASTYKNFLRVGCKRGYRNPRAWAAFRTLDFAQSQTDCETIALACGYKKGWGYHQWSDIVKRRKVRGK